MYDSSLKFKELFRDYIQGYISRISFKYMVQGRGNFIDCVSG